ncbi:DUF72 domain-containing protein [Schlesneria paludicola]|uniref:DUF72 domain-containing protein n=1 Tax=Schlesneria paludicola TaxID=360056 RepID=UPI00029B17F5|nr:DUF72 domain-containing protein [Schlesneria paludicola]
MQFFVGTSGYSYKEWKGAFYPEKFPPADMLKFYGQHFASVELNNTFYHAPTAESLTPLATQVPAGFQFAVKAPQTITHRKRLLNCDDAVNEFISAVQSLARRRGPLLFQLPPNFKKDIARLETLLNVVQKRVPVTFEFRHESWLDDEVVECLRKHSATLCAADAEDTPPVRVIKTADWGYLRLRREMYSDDDLKMWAETIRENQWSKVYVYFKHEETGTGPKFAKRLSEFLEE